MTSFEKWLKNRDLQLSEVLDQEHLQAHNYDALGAAQKKFKKRKNNKKKKNQSKILNLLSNTLKIGSVMKNLERKN